MVSVRTIVGGWAGRRGGVLEERQVRRGEAGEVGVHADACAPEAERERAVHVDQVSTHRLVPVLCTQEKAGESRKRQKENGQDRGRATGRNEKGWREPGLRETTKLFLPSYNSSYARALPSYPLPMLEPSPLLSSPFSLPVLEPSLSLSPLSLPMLEPSPLLSSLCHSSYARALSSLSPFLALFLFLFNSLRSSLFSLPLSLSHSS